MSLFWLHNQSWRFWFWYVLLDERSYENILVYDISLIGPKPLHMRFDNIDRFIRVYNGTRYFILFDPKKYDAIYNRIRYFASQKK